MAYRATIGDRVKITRFADPGSPWYKDNGVEIGQTGAVYRLADEYDGAPEGAFYLERDGDGERLGFEPSEVEAIEYATLGTENAA